MVNCLTVPSPSIQPIASSNLLNQELFLFVLALQPNKFKYYFSLNLNKKQSSYNRRIILNMFDFIQKR